MDDDMSLDLEEQLRPSACLQERDEAFFDEPVRGGWRKLAYFLGGGDIWVARRETETKVVNFLVSCLI